MTKEIKLPQLGQTMEEGTIVNCLVEVGQKVNKGDILFEIETDKATLEMESPAEGFVKTIIAQNGQTLPVGEILLILGNENEKVSAQVGSDPKQQKPADKAGEPAKITDKIDIIAALKEAQTGVQQVYKLGQKVPLSSLGRVMADEMIKSKREKPCFYLTVNVDVTELATLAEKLKVSTNDFIIKALAMGMAKWPIMTGRLEGDSIRLADSAGIGIAVAVNGGVVVPIVKDADKKSLAQIAECSEDFVERTKAGKLQAGDIEGGCITISNLGGAGIDSFIPIVIPGQCSILGIGKITEACVMRKENITARKFMKMTLAVDHRIANGAEAAQFFNYVAELLGEPQKLV